MTSWLKQIHGLPKQVVNDFQNHFVAAKFHLTEELASQDAVITSVKSIDNNLGLALNREFDNGYGGTEGIPIVIITQHYVIFPVQYDGAEWLSYVPRNMFSLEEFIPEHVGGG